MKILAIDTATTTGSVAVTDGGKLLAEATIARKETHSIHLMGMIDQTLRLAGIDIHQVDGFAYTKGPGSFTGLRIGLSVVKGLAFAKQKPMVGVSSLEALAYQAEDDTRLVCALVDARNKEVYCAQYRWQEGALKPVTYPQSLLPDKFVDQIGEPCLLIGDGAIRYREMLVEQLGGHAKFALSHQNVIRGVSIAALSAPLFEMGQFDDIYTGTPFYIRKSYAEEKKGKPAF